MCTLSLIYITFTPCHSPALSSMALCQPCVLCCDTCHYLHIVQCYHLLPKTKECIILPNYLIYNNLCVDLWSAGSKYGKYTCL